MDMIKRNFEGVAAMLTVALLVIAALLLGACSALGGVRNGPLGPVVDVAEPLAIVAAEQRFQREAERQLALIAADRPTPSRAREVSLGAQGAFAVLQIARIAYDITLGSTAPQATVDQVVAAREATDAAYTELQRQLGLIISPPV